MISSPDTNFLMSIHCENLSSVTSAMKPQLPSLNQTSYLSAVGVAGLLSISTHSYIADSQEWSHCCRGQLTCTCNSKFRPDANGTCRGWGNEEQLTSSHRVPTSSGKFQKPEWMNEGTNRSTFVGMSFLALLTSPPILMLLLIMYLAVQ